jgi:thymidylate kinase
VFEPRFVVLLGPDYAGKSTLMRELAAAEPFWRLLSVDGGFIAPEHAVLSALKKALFNQTLPGLGTHHSADFVTALLQTAVVYLRDRIFDGAPGQPVVVDSYYYKILAKCSLIGASAKPMFDWWREFPQPRRVLFLDVDPVTAWARSGNGALANRMEFHGPRADRDSFIEFQTDLRSALLDEVVRLPVELVSGTGDAGATLARVHEVIADEFAC